MEIGVNLLRCGAEIKRVEETIEYVCRAYGATEVDVFAIPSLIVATIVIDGDTYTSKVKRNHEVTTDLFRLEKYNKLSRQICKDRPSLDEVRNSVKTIQQLKDYNLFIIYVGAILTAFGFAIFFGGTIRDGVAAGLIGIIMTFINRIKRKSFNQMLHTLICSLIGGFLCVVTCWINLAENINYVMIGAIMIIIPGLAIGTSIKDILCDDVLSGSIRLFQSMVTALAIAAGFSIWTKIYGGEVSFNNSASPYMIIIASLIGTLGYSIIFNNKYKHLPFVCFGGVLTTALYLLTLNTTNNVFIGALVGAIGAATLAEVLARVLKAPTIVFLLSSIIPLIPGAMLFSTMYYVINWNLTMCVNNLIGTLLVSLAIALGIIVASVIAQLITRLVHYIKERKKNA